MPYLKEVEITKSRRDSSETSLSKLVNTIIEPKTTASNKPVASTE
jgi:hypothetical protein